MEEVLLDGGALLMREPKGLRDVTELERAVHRLHRRHTRSANHGSSRLKSMSPQAKITKVIAIGMSLP
jgi:hypothetical protein